MAGEWAAHQRDSRRSRRGARDAPAVNARRPYQGYRGNTVFGRAENVQKDELFEAPSPFAGQVFRVSELTLGYVYDLPIAKHLAIGLGVAGTLNIVPSAIKPAYGDNPAGYMPFLRLKVR